MKKKLSNIINKYAVQEITILGNIKTEFRRLSMQEWIEVKDLLNLKNTEIKIHVVRGNHDSYVLNILSKFIYKKFYYSCCQDK